MQSISSPFGHITLLQAAEVHPISELAQALLNHLPLKPGLQVLDLGTGSGLFAIAAAKMDGEVMATDIDASILQVAQKNADLNGVSSIQWKVASYFQGLEGQKFDLIIANLPQTPAPYPIRLDKWGGPFGTTHLEKIIQEAPRFLSPSGKLFITQSSLANPVALEKLTQPHFTRKLKAEIQRLMTPEEYESYQSGLWDYLLRLKEAGKAEIEEKHQQYFFYGRVYEYQLVG